ncbi:MAG: HAD family hydrolase [Spirochaetia bacterium]|nr:HAD family hydrolase [Spirochaetia bacterium]
MKSTTSYKAILFDLDGTIADTIKDITFAMNKALNRYGYEAISDAEGKLCVGRGLKNALKKAVILKEGTVIEDQLDEMLTILLDTYSHYPAQFTNEYDGTTQFLTRLINKGYILGVLSNKEDPLVQVIVEKLFPTIPFSFVLGAHSDYPLKPDPASLQAFMGKYSIKEEELLFVGDSEVDGLTAKAAQVRCALVSWGFRGKETLISSGFTNIYDTFEELEKGEL